MEVQTTVITEKMIGQYKRNSVVMQLRQLMAIPADVQRFWDDQSDGVKYYLSTLAPEHVSTVVGVVCCSTCCQEDSDEPEGWKELVLSYH